MATREWRIYGEPVGKARPRVALRHGKAHAYTPAKSATWEALAVAYIRQAWTVGPITIAAHVDVEAVFTRPKRLMGARVVGKTVPHVSRPDCDNVLKSALDALVRAGVLRDDALVSDAWVGKRYANSDEVAHVLVRVTWEE